jgi:hypothetical protein
MYSHLQVILHQKINEVCPIDGISFGCYSKKSTWEISYQESATLEQRKAAYQLMMDFVWNEDEEALACKNARIEEYKKNPNTKAGFILYTDTHPNATFEDYMRYVDEIQI